MLERFLHRVVAEPKLHLRWLNTLSFLENCGARKLAACEHPTLVKTEMLKHAAEEFRHAHYLKQQLGKLSPTPPADYSVSSLLGGWKTLHYLDRLEVAICRLYPSSHYELITYAIEKRAEALYPIYSQVLKHYGAPISVNAIIKEEAGHLAEMEKLVRDPRQRAQVVVAENTLFHAWFQTASCTLPSG